MKKTKTVEDYIQEQESWSESLTLLRGIMLSSGLEEAVKWGMPTYTLEGKNIAGLGAFKSYCGVWFFQGALLKDEQNKLINAQEGKTAAMRQWRFSSMEEIDAPLLRSYLAEAMRNQRAGREIKPARPESKPLIITGELSGALREDAELKRRFDQLSLSKQREFADYIREAKKAETRERRLEKVIPLILEGKGLNDQYK